MVTRLLLIYEYYFLKDVDNSFEISLCDLHQVVSARDLQELDIFLHYLVVVLREREILVPLIH